MRLRALFLLLAFLACNWTASAQSLSVKQTSTGNCSPNQEGIVIVNQLFCIQKGLDAEAKRNLNEILDTLQKLAQADGPIKNRIILKLNEIAAATRKSGHAYEELRKFYFELLRQVADILPQLRQIDSKVDVLIERSASGIPQAEVLAIASQLRSKPEELDGTVDLSHLKLTLADRVSSAANESAQPQVECRGLKFDGELKSDRSDMPGLIDKSELTCDYKRHLYERLPQLSDETIAKMRHALEDAKSGNDPKSGREETAQDSSLSRMSELATSDCRLTYLQDLEIKYAELLWLIAHSESMDCAERQGWYEILPSMTQEQVSRLYDILKTEQRQLAELDQKYGDEITSLINSNSCLEISKSFQAALGEDQVHASGGALRYSRKTYQTALDYADKGCAVQAKGEEDTVLRALATLNTDIASNDAELAFMLTQLFSMKGYENAARRYAMARATFRLEPDRWEHLAALVDSAANERDMSVIRDATKLVIARMKMPELYGNSEQDIRRKLMAYWWYLYSATELNDNEEISQAAIIGYNQTKLLLERNPSEWLLNKIAFFSAHIWGSKKIDQDLKSSYFLAIYQAERKMLDAGRINAEQYANLLLGLSWYCLIAGVPDDAIIVARGGLNVKPEYLALYTNLAHGYMLQGDRDQALKIYRQHVGQRIGDKLWEDVVIDDFQKLSAMGIKVVDDPVDRKIFEAR
jgi:hypothetical protein